MEHEEKHPVQLIVPKQEQYSRLLAAATLLLAIPKLILLIPHLILLYVLGFVLLVVAMIGQCVVLFTGKYPQGLFDLVHGIFQWQVRVNMYLLGLSDKYPPFSLK